MKPRNRAGVAATLALAVAGATAVAAISAAHAATEPIAAALPAPSIVGPDDTGTAYPRPVVKTVKLDWSAVPGATGYRVQLGTDATWSTDPVFTQDVFYSEDTLPLWVPNATYFWRVAALNGSQAGHWSSEAGQPHSDASFTKGWRAAPQLLAVGPIVAVPTFRWQPVAEASGYEVQVSTDPLFGAQGNATASPDTTPSAGTGAQSSPQPGKLMADCFTARTRYTPSQSVVGLEDSVGPCQYNVPPPSAGTIYWRVRALDAYTQSSQQVSTTPVASQGVSYQTYKTSSSTPDLTSGCPQPAGGPSASPSTSASPSASASPTAAPFQTLGCDPTRASVEGSWSTVGSFANTSGSVVSVAGPQVATASLAGEPNGLCTVTNAGAPEAEHARCVDIPTLTWPAITGKPVYRVLIGLDDAFTNIQYEAETDALTWTPSGSWRDGSYYYAVQACDSTGCGPITTTPPSFTKVTPRPNLGPAPGNSGEIHLSWQAYASSLAAVTGQAETQDAYAYRVQVATTDHPGYDQVVDEQIVDGTTFTPLKSYGDGTFLWRVQPLDSKGNQLPWSYSQSFTRDSTPPTVVSVSPSSAVAVMQPLTVTFSEPVTGVSSTSLSLSPAAPTTVTVTSSTTATMTPTKPLLPGATYGVVVSSAVHDLSGNVAVPSGPTLTVSPRVGDSSKAITYTGSWHVLASSSAVGGSFHSSIPTPTAKTSATMTFAGIGVSLQSCRGPNNGYLDVYVDGVKKARVNLYRSYTGCGVRVLSLTGLARATHTLKLVGIGAHSSSSKGNAVAVDNLTVAP